MTLNQILARGRIIRETVADYCRGKIDRPSAVAILKLAGISAQGADAIINTIDANTPLKQSYMEQQQ